MPAHCQVTGRSPGFGNRVSASHRRIRCSDRDGIETVVAEAAAWRGARLMARNDIRSRRHKPDRLTEQLRPGDPTPRRLPRGTLMAKTMIVRHAGLTCDPGCWRAVENDIHGQ